MTLEKMLTMMRLFNEDDVDPDIPKHWAIPPKDIEDMLNIEFIPQKANPTIAQAPILNCLEVTKTGFKTGPQSS